MDLRSPDTDNQATMTVDVVVPVYGALETTLKCLRSVIQSTSILPTNLIVIDDCSVEPEVATALESLSKQHNFIFLRNTSRLGFPSTSNIGFGLNHTNDVVLLNSDVEVYGDWLDRIVEIAYSDERIGTVTPITNNGEISSYPSWLSDNHNPLEIPPFELDKMASIVNRRQWIESPTGVGFCMFFKRECLNEVGEFNAGMFSLGYGEENDFSQRAIKSGWLNAITPSVFVTHIGGQSFGQSSTQLKLQAGLKMETAHPEYSQEVRDFIKSQPFLNHFDRLDSARIAKHAADKAVLLITHSVGGGTERHVQELRNLLKEEGTPVLFARPADSGQAIIIGDPEVAETPNLKPIHISAPQEFLSKIQGLGVKHVHVHNLMGYSDLMPDFLAEALIHSGIAYDFTVHDYQYWCPRVNLVGITGLYCGEPSLDSCQSCVNLLGSPNGKPVVWNWRRSYEGLLRGAKSVFVPSQDTVNRLERHLPGIKTVLRPHEQIRSTHAIDGISKKNNLGLSPKIHSVMRIGLIGSISREKGSEILFQVAQYCSKSHPEIAFVVIGTTDLNSALEALGNTKILGPFDDAHLANHIREQNLTIIWFPGTTPETYSYTLSRAIESELPLAAFAIGAIGQRILDSKAGLTASIELALDNQGMVEFLFATSENRNLSNIWHSTQDHSQFFPSYYESHG